MHCGLAPSDSISRSIQRLTRKIDLLVKLVSVFKLNTVCRKWKYLILKYIHNVSVVMIFAVQKLSLCVLHNCEYIIILRVSSAKYNKSFFIIIFVW